MNSGKTDTGARAPVRAAAAEPAGGRPICLLVLGMHRSGTSALTRVLNLLGADLPADLVEPTARNPLGFWEWSLAYRMHNEILASVDSRWDDWGPIQPGWFVSPKGKAAARALADMLVGEFAGKPFFVVKDPRACRLVPLWTRAAELADIDLLPILIVRHPLEVAGSLTAAKGLNRSQALLLWLRYVLDADAATRGRRRMILTYDQLLGDWRTAMTATAEAFSFVWPRWTPAAEEEIDGFLDGEQRHHRAKDGASKRAPDILAWTRRAYEAMCELVKDEGSAPVQRSLDELRASFEEASSMFAPLSRALRAEQEQTSRKRESAEKALQTATLALEQAQARIGDLQAELERTRAERTDLERQAAGVRGKLERRDEELASARRELKERQAELARAAAAVVELEREFSGWSFEPGEKNRRVVAFSTEEER